LDNQAQKILLGRFGIHHLPFLG